MNNENNFGASRPGDSLEKGGLKYDFGKTEVFQGLFEYFPRALMEVANVSSYGARKYDWNGWQHVEDGYNRYSNAHGRHIFLKGQDGEYDIGPGGSGLLHDAQQAWNALAKLEIGLRDGRYTSTRGFPLPDKANTAKSAEVLHSPVDRILGGAESAGFKSFSDFEEQRDVKAATKAVPATFEEMLGQLLGGKVQVITDPEEWFRLTGSYPPGHEPQFELTAKAKAAIKRGSAAARKKPAVKAPAKGPARAPARKR